jgi:hypothetical protein
MLTMRFRESGSDEKSHSQNELSKLYTNTASFVNRTLLSFDLSRHPAETFDAINGGPEKTEFLLGTSRFEKYCPFSHHMLRAAA